MKRVIITYTNGENVNFAAKEFNISASDIPSSGFGRLRKFSYEDENGEENAVYLTPGQVAGIVVISQ